MVFSLPPSFPRGIKRSCSPNVGIFMTTKSPFSTYKHFNHGSEESLNGLQILQRSNKSNIPKSSSFPRYSQLAMQLNLPHPQHSRTSLEIYSSTQHHQAGIILEPNLTSISYLKANHGKDSYSPLMLFHKLRR
jgi:hypothetical protein